MADIYLTEPQERFVFSESRHPGMCAGYGAGKSQAGVVRILMRALRYRGLGFAFVEPTFDLVRLIAWPRFEEMLDSWEVPYVLNKSESILHLQNESRIIFRSADNPARLVGFEVADSLIDEIDILSEKDASDTWIKMIGRTRQKKPDGSANTVACVSTPEGFKWMYRMYEKERRQGYELIRASTASNPYLPPDYLDTLIATYPANLLQAYSEGMFVNLTAGSVYAEFDRTLNASAETIRASETLHIGLDFNVTKMAAVVHVLRGDDPHAVEELTGIYDTPTMIRVVKDRYQGHPIMVYPDASGGSRKSNNASESDLSLLRQAGFRVCVNPANPAVKDRVLSANAMINKSGARRYRVNPERCPELVEALEKQSYTASGEPDKTQGFDHCFSGDTLVRTPVGVTRMDQLPREGHVMGPFGRFVPYVNAGKKLIDSPTLRVVLDGSSSIQCTPQHQLLRGDGVWIDAKDLKAGDVLFVSCQRSSRSIAERFTTFAATTFSAMVNACTAVFGRMLTETSLLAATFITRTETVATTTSTTYKCCEVPSTTLNTQKIALLRRQGLGIAMVMASEFWRQQPYGTGRKQVETGIGSITLNTQTGCMRSGIAGYATSAACHSTRQMSLVGSAPKPVWRSTAGHQGGTTKNERALFAGVFLRLTAINELPVVARSVLRRLAILEYRFRKQCTAWRAARIRSDQSGSLEPCIAHMPAVLSARVVAVRQDEPVDTYCLTAPIHGSFALANGVVVANCIDAATYFIAYRYPVVKRTAIVTPLRM